MLWSADNIMFFSVDKTIFLAADNTMFLSAVTTVFLSPHNTLFLSADNTMFLSADKTIFLSAEDIRDLMVRVSGELSLLADTARNLSAGVGILSAVNMMLLLDVFCRLDFLAKP